MSIDHSELARLKLPLVQLDYQTSFNAANRLYDRVNHIHALEVTVVAALIALTAKGTSERAVLIAGLIVIVGCAFLDAALQVRIFYTGEEAQRIEVLLQETDPEMFTHNVVSWTFGNTRAMRLWYTAPYPQIKVLYWSVRSPTFWLWHLLLTLALTAYWVVGSVWP